MAHLDDFRKYARLIESALATAPPAFTPSAESDTAIQVERGVAYPILLIDPKRPVGNLIDRILEVGLRTNPAPDSAWRDLSIGAHAVVDRNGHHRPVYRGLLIYSLLQSYRVAYEHLSTGDFGRWEEGLRPWVDLLEAELGEVEFPIVDHIPAIMGAAACDAAWMALALFVAGKVFVRDAWTDLASATFGRFIRSQQPSGAFLTPTSSDNPETLWYHELVILHAAASYAVQSEDRPLAAAVAKNTALHLAETQPDHASNQPWALFAFIWNASSPWWNSRAAVRSGFEPGSRRSGDVIFEENMRSRDNEEPGSKTQATPARISPRAAEARPFADQLLHAAQTLGQSGIASMLLADALYCLRLFTRTS